MKRGLASLGLVIAGWLAPDVARACSCGTGPGYGTASHIRGAVRHADAVFEGWVREASGHESESRYVLDVRRTWKGQLGAQVTVLGGVCLHFTQGESYVVFAYKDTREAGAFTASMCGYTSAIGHARPVIDVLGEGRLPGGGQGCALGERGAAGPMLVVVVALRRRRRVMASAGGSGRARCVGR